MRFAIIKYLQETARACREAGSDHDGGFCGPMKRIFIYHAHF